MIRRRNVVILDNIRSSYNVGSVIRTADAFGRDVWLCGYTPSPLTNDKVCKTALGAEKNVSISEFFSVKSAIDLAIAQSYIVLVGEITHTANSLSETLFAQESSYCLILGNEVEGVSQDILNMDIKQIYIPMIGIKESLNVSQSAGVFMREISRQQQYNRK